jgi:hypothetical protein
MTTPLPVESLLAQEGAGAGGNEATSPGPAAGPSWRISPALRRQIMEALAHPPKMTCEEFLAWADEDTLAEWVNGDAIVKERLQYLRNEIKYPKDERREVSSFEDYASDTRLRKAVERSRQVAIKACLDIARRIIILKRRLGDFDALAGAVVAYLGQG